MIHMLEDLANAVTHKMDHIKISQYYLLFNRYKPLVLD